MGELRRKSKDIKDSLWQYVELFWEFFKIGIFTIGGGMAMIPQMQEIAVNKNKWMTEEEMIDCIAVSQSMPGVVAVNSATYIGRSQRGFRGAVAATLGVALPSFIVIILVASVLGAIDENRYIQGALTGIKAAVCGLILVTTVRLGKPILKDPLTWILAVASLTVVSLLDISAIWVILGSIVVGLIYSIVFRSRKSDGNGKDEGARK